jgi:hypothetical protein
MLDEWERNSAGNVALTPIVSMEAQVWERRIVGLRLELSADPARGPEGPVAVQVGMSPEQAAHLMRLLQWCADHLEEPPPASQVN